MFVQIPGSFVVRHLGVRTTLILSTFIGAVLSALTPLGIQVGDWKTYCGIRLAQGICQGLSIPCLHEHLAKWSPPPDRKLLGVVAYSGIYCGTILASLVSGFIAGSPIGWPGMMYLSAAVGFLWCLLWWFLGENDAASSYWISAPERNYIQRTLCPQHRCLQGPPPVPWRAILGSVPFLALVIVKTSQQLVDSTIELQVPSYISGVLGMSIENNGLSTALPHLVQWAVSYVYLFLAEVAVMRRLIRRTPCESGPSPFPLGVRQQCLLASDTWTSVTRYWLSY